MSREEIVSDPEIERLEAKNAQVEYELDLDNLPTKDHNWIDRGVFIVCKCHGIRVTNPKHRQ